MGRLPTREDLGERRLNSEAPIVSPQVSVGGQQQLAQSLARITERVQNSQFNKALIEFQKDKLEADSAFDRDTDFETHVERYGKMLSDSVERHSQSINNPRLRREFESKTSLYRAQGSQVITAKAFDKEVSQGLANLNETLTTGRQNYLRASTQQDKLYSREIMESSIDFAEDSGYIDANNAQVMRQKMAVDLAVASVEMEDPDKQLELLKNENIRAIIPADQLKVMENKAKAKLVKVGDQYIDDVIKSYESNLQVTQEEYDQAVSLASLKPKAKAEAQLKELKIARMASEYIRLPRAERKGLPEQLTGVANTDARLALEYADEVIERELNADAYSFAVRQDLIKEVPLNLEDPGSIQQRLDQAEYLTTHYGRSISPLKEEEADRLVEALPKMTPEAKTDLALAFGSSEAVWEQLDKKNASMFAMTGAIGDRVVMAGVFRGEKLLADKMVELPLDRSLMLAEFDDLVEDLYMGRDRKAMFDTSVAYYASLIGPGAEGGFFRDDSFEDAVEAVSGGIGTISGHKVELPRGISEDDFEDYIDGMTADSVASFGGAWGISNEKAAELIRDSRIISIPNKRYIVEIQTVAGKTLLKKSDNTGEPFTFTYDLQVADVIAEEQDKPLQLRRALPSGGN